jgi:hypothetical protein
MVSFMQSYETFFFRAMGYVTDDDHYAHLVSRIL